MGISQYGTPRRDGGAAGDQRAYDRGTDLKVGGKDSINQADFSLSRRYHSSPPFTKEQAFGNQKLGYLENLMSSGMLSHTAGLRDPMEETAFYGAIIRAFNHFVGFGGEIGANNLPSGAPPFRKLGRIDDYDIGSITSRAARGNTVVGILANITKKVAELDESALFRDLGIDAWNNDQRNRVESIITEMVNFIAELEGD